MLGIEHPVLVEIQRYPNLKTTMCYNASETISAAPGWTTISQTVNSFGFAC
jgi:hypothetical protein